jgi:hypothetical protein
VGRVVESLWNKPVDKSTFAWVCVSDKLKFADIL